MKILGINGSPRIGGNTDTLIGIALEGAASAGCETEKIILEELDISPCREEEYDNVNPEGLSVVDDDMRTIYRKIDEADGLILASPVFFGSLSAQTKTMIDRFQCVWLAREVFKKHIFEKEKPGIFICAGAQNRKDFFENARSIVRHFFATVNIIYEDEGFFPGLDSKESAASQPDILKKAYGMGERLAEACLKRTE